METTKQSPKIPPVVVTGSMKRKYGSMKYGVPLNPVDTAPKIGEQLEKKQKKQLSLTIKEKGMSYFSGSGVFYDVVQMAGDHDRQETFLKSMREIHSSVRKLFAYEDDVTEMSSATTIKQESSATMTIPLGMSPHLTQSVIANWTQQELQDMQNHIFESDIIQLYAPIMEQILEHQKCQDQPPESNRITEDLKPYQIIGIFELNRQNHEVKVFPLCGKQEQVTVMLPGKAEFYLSPLESEDFDKCSLIQDSKYKCASRGVSHSSEGYVKMEEGFLPTKGAVKPAIQDFMSSLAQNDVCIQKRER